MFWGLGAMWGIRCDVHPPSLFGGLTDSVIVLRRGVPEFLEPTDQCHSSQLRPVRGFAASLG